MFLFFHPTPQWCSIAMLSNILVSPGKLNGQTHQDPMLHFTTPQAVWAVAAAGRVTCPIKSKSVCNYWL